MVSIVFDQRKKDRGGGLSLGDALRCYEAEFSLTLGGLLFVFLEERHRVAAFVRFSVCGLVLGELGARKSSGKYW